MRTKWTILDLTVQIFLLLFNISAASSFYQRPVGIRFLCRQKSLLTFFFKSKQCIRVIFHSTTETTNKTEERHSVRRMDILA